MNFHDIASLALLSFFLGVVGIFLRGRIPVWAARSIIALSFVLTTIALNRYDVLGKNFNTSGVWLFVYNLLRTLPLVFWAMIFTSSGEWFLSALSSRGNIGFQGTGERVLARFFSGAAICSLVFFVLGLVGLLRVEVSLIYGVLFLISSRGPLPFWEEGVRKAWTWFRMLANADRVAVGVAAFSLLLFAARLFLINTMYPAGSGCDVYNHYLPYLKEVIRTGSTLPNDVWYHFFYSKGVGISFFAMLTGGMFGPKAVSFLLILWSTGLVASLTFRATKSPFYGLLSVVAFLGIFATGPSSTGEFFKHHVLLLCFLFSTFWFLISFVWGRGNDEAILGAMVCGLCGIVAVPTSLPFFGILIGLIFLVLVFSRKWIPAIQVFCLGILALMVFAGLLLLNFSLTGLCMETPIRLFWNLADPTRFSRWVSPYLVQYLLEGSGQGVGIITLDRMLQITENWFTGVLRLNLLPWLVPSARTPALLIVPLLVLYFVFTNRGARCRSLLFVSCVFLTVSVFFSKLVDQESSIYRMFIFAVPFSVVAVISIWYSALRSIFEPAFLRRLGAPCLLCLSFLTLDIAGTIRMPYDLAGAAIALRQTVFFYLGKSSIRQAFVDSGQYWWSADKARKIVGADGKMLTFVINGGIYGASCSFPGKGLLTEVNFAILPLWHRVAFGPAEEAKNLLLKEKIVGFLFDLKDPMMFGAIPYSDLFSPVSLRKNFNLFQLGQTTYLAQLVDGVPTDPWPEDILRAFQVKQQSLATLTGRADFQEMIAKEIGKTLDMEGTSTKARVFQQIKPALEVFLAGQLNPDSVSNVVSATETLLAGQAETQVDIGNSSMTAGEIGRLVEENVQQSLESELGAPVVEMLKLDQSSSKMRNVYDNVRTIYLHNEGGVSRIQRPQDLPQSKGWQ